VSQELNIYTVRPDGTALWIPAITAESMGIQWADHLTHEQYEGSELQGLIARRIQAEKQRGKR